MGGFMSRHPQGSYMGLLRKPEDLLAHTNVRRWLYRLLTKDKDTALIHRDLLSDNMNGAIEPCEVAREGLALGFAKIYAEEFRLDLHDWFATEQSKRVKLALVDNLAFMAKRHDDPVAADLLQLAYLKEGSESLLRAKIVSVAPREWGLNGAIPTYTVPASEQS